jgi:hypothetical protein
MKAVISLALGQGRKTAFRSAARCPRRHMRSPSARFYAETACGRKKIDDISAGGGCFMMLE